MSPLSFSMALLSACLLSFCTIAQNIGCPALQRRIHGRCCNECPPGTYMKDFCSVDHQTICQPCEEGYYSPEHNTFDRCEQCSCQHGKCVRTNGTCLCPSGFLCSNSTCSVCEMNTCSVEEKPKRTEHPPGQYLYQCEPKCPEYQYFDSKEDTCKPKTQCITLGLVEKIPGNNTHDSICQKPHDNNSVYMILCFGFVLLSLTLFIFVSHTCWRNIRKQAANKKPIQAVQCKTSDFHLSKEESGFQLVIQDESKDSSSLSMEDLEKVSSLS
ncbi:tumor necrosis factor receptor superfamily member 18 [Nothobranchius furzeri]|uniref:Tumor necrosis factor receptor superfamily member 5-like n=3 Tax=Nothobranchius furzeri TaxID=105023 RepID=A0A9D3BIC7_NOTFU|nr:tumor necrosis factor receptor superfamily member 5 [Nothobranchius furzeri]KAF7207923.1 tumor necrosis factor receptor superfamily member 5-like [Nothobranchius furzeri]